MNHHVTADATETYEAELDSVAAERPSVAVLRAVAALTNRSPQSLAPLAETIDPDALDDCVESGADGDCRIEFRYEGYIVEITGDERIGLRPTGRTDDRPTG
ncbi:MAG: HalOD1 output domain-containing protein [Halosimplex sp.]